MTPGLKFSITTSALLYQASGDFEIGLELEVQRDAALVPVPCGVRRRIEARAARGIDADHVGAEISEQHCRHGSGDVVAEIDDFDSVRGRKWSYGAIRPMESVILAQARMHFKLVQSQSGFPMCCPRIRWISSCQTDPASIDERR